MQAFFKRKATIGFLIGLIFGLLPLLSNCFGSPDGPICSDQYLNPYEINVNCRCEKHIVVQFITAVMFLVSALFITPIMLILGRGFRESEIYRILYTPNLFVIIPAIVFSGFGYLIGHLLDKRRGK